MIYKGNPAITTIVLHNTAVSRSVQPLQFDSVNGYHKGKWGMQSELGYYTGYNFFCEPTGRRIQSRKIGEETIAQIGNNCDSPSRCGMVSYCMAGYFIGQEKPTQMQVDDFILFIREIQSKYPKVVLKQHKDVYPGRTCAELSDAEIQAWISEPTTETKDEQIARLEEELAKVRAMITRLVGMVTALIQIIKK